MNESLIHMIYSRRVTRRFTDESITDRDLETIVEAARWAPSGGNRRLQRFIIVTEAKFIRYIRFMSPGLDETPAAIIIICTDWKNAASQGYPEDYSGFMIDVGMAAENMLLVSHALGIGAGPVISFNKEAIRAIIDLPSWVSPDLIICLGYPNPDGRGKTVKHRKKINWKDLTYWERYQ